MDWINHYKVKLERDGTKVITGGFIASAGEFTVTYRGDGGNADTYTITLSGGQFDMDGKPTTVTIVGSWEFNELSALIDLIKKTV